MPNNPTTVDIVWERGSGTDENVETWWYEGLTLVVRYLDGSETRYPYGNVVDRR
jgi:hypothetical protein